MTPSPVAQHHLDSIISYLPGVFDGDVESVHQCRVATRRFREVAPLLTDSDRRPLEVIKSAGRHLGRVRELDVMSELLESLEFRTSSASALELHVARLAVRDRQRAERRAMVKAVERLDLQKLRDDFRAGGQGTALWRWITGRSARWVELIWTRLAKRADQAVIAVQRTPGVYLPNRAHRARVAVKKLRYALEVAEDTGVWHPRRMLKDLRRIQGTLGDVHDLQVLLDSLESLIATGETPASGTSAIATLLQDDMARRYADYVGRRDRVFRIAALCTRAAANAQRRWRGSAPLVAATAFTGPLLIESVLQPASGISHDAPVTRGRRTAVARA